MVKGQGVDIFVCQTPSHCCSCDLKYMCCLCWTTDSSAWACTYNMTERNTCSVFLDCFIAGTARLSNPIATPDLLATNPSLRVQQRNTVTLQLHLSDHWFGANHLCAKLDSLSACSRTSASPNSCSAHQAWHIAESTVTKPLATESLVTQSLAAQPQSPLDTSHIRHCTTLAKSAVLL